MNIELTDKDKIRVTNPDDLYGIMQRILLRENDIDREKEHFWIVGMNLAGVILYIELISMGSVRATTVEPMNVFRVAVLKGASRMIAVHNHPSGSLKPSAEDQDLTDRLIQVGRILEISMEDHLIINPTTYMSFKCAGLMEGLEKSLRYVPTYRIIEKVRMEEKAVMEEAVKAEIIKYKLSTTQSLLARDIAMEEIAEIMNTTVEEVKKIKVEV